VQQLSRKHVSSTQHLTFPPNVPPQQMTQLSHPNLTSVPKATSEKSTGWKNSPALCIVKRHPGALQMSENLALISLLVSNCGRGFTGGDNRHFSGFYKDILTHPTVTTDTQPPPQQH
jgi:hypothetical protein